MRSFRWRAIRRDSASLRCCVCVACAFIAWCKLCQWRLAEDPMIPKVEAIFAPLSDARSPGVAVLVRQRRTDRF